MNQVEQRIQEAIEQNRKNLDLSSLGLTALPNSFLNIAPQLEVLTLAKNGFINLPRALNACRNLKVLILDEATSALDAGAEERVLQNIKKELVNTVVISITHSAKNYIYFDEILELGDYSN